MSEVMSHDSVEEAPFINGSLQAGDALVGFREPGLRGVGLIKAAGALASAYGEGWPAVDLTDLDGRLGTLGELVTAEQRITARYAAKLATTASVEVHGLTDMYKYSLVDEMRSLLDGTGLGVEITDPFESQLMRLVQFFANDRRPASDRYMYETFTMAHGPVVITPNPEAMIESASHLPTEVENIGTTIEEPVIRIHSKGTEQRGEVLSYDI